MVLSFHVVDLLYVYHDKALCSDGPYEFSYDDDYNDDDYYY